MTSTAVRAAELAWRKADVAAAKADVAAAKANAAHAARRKADADDWADYTKTRLAKAEAQAVAAEAAWREAVDAARPTGARRKRGIKEQT